MKGYPIKVDKVNQKDMPKYGYWCNICDGLSDDDLSILTVSIPGSYPYEPEMYICKDCLREIYKQSLAKDEN